MQAPHVEVLFRENERWMGRVVGIGTVETHVRTRDPTGTRHNRVQTVDFACIYYYEYPVTLTDATSGLPYEDTHPAVPACKYVCPGDSVGIVSLACIIRPIVLIPNLSQRANTTTRPPPARPPLTRTTDQVARIQPQWANTPHFFVLRALF